MTWLKIAGACEYAGGLDRKTLYAAVDAGKLEVRRIGDGRNMLFADIWIDAWVLSLPRVKPEKGKAGKTAGPRNVTSMLERAS
jgi:hypothetical protein